MSASASGPNAAGEGPMVSVVTVCFNAEKTIKACLESLKEQTYSRIEHIVIDGKSSDGTLEVVEQHGLPGCRVYSEKDTGIYNAMNKGFRQATGDVIGILNADDVFCDKDVISSVAAAFRDNPGSKWLYGVTEIEAFDGSTFRMGREPKARMKWYDWRAYSIFGCVQQSIFIRKEMLGEAGYFDEGYRICSDLDLTIRMWKKHPPLFLDRSVGYLKFGGASFSNRVALEARQVHDRHFGKSLLNVLAYYRYSLAHVFKRKPFGLVFVAYRLLRKAVLRDR